MKLFLEGYIHYWNAIQFINRLFPLWGTILLPCMLTFCWAEPLFKIGPNDRNVFKMLLINISGTEQTLAYQLQLPAVLCFVFRINLEFMSWKILEHPNQKWILFSNIYDNFPKLYGKLRNRSYLSMQQGKQLCYLHILYNISYSLGKNNFCVHVCVGTREQILSQWNLIYIISTSQNIAYANLFFQIIYFVSKFTYKVRLQK